MLRVKPQSMGDKLISWLQGTGISLEQEAERYFSSNESWRGFISFESPWSEKPNSSCSHRFIRSATGCWIKT